MFKDARERAIDLTEWIDDIEDDIDDETEVRIYVQLDIHEAMDMMEKLLVL